MGWVNTLLYPAVLVAIFLGGQALGAPPALAAVPALLALVVSLPWRVKQLWGQTQPWISLGWLHHPAKPYSRHCCGG